jgi:hypothetical protein
MEQGIKKFRLAGFEPLVKISYRHIEYQNKTYKRRLRVNRFTAHLIDEDLGTNLFNLSKQFRFLVLDDEDIKKVCELLKIEYKEINTYLDIDFTMQSFKNIP